MARIAGVTIPQQKRLEVALTYIYGIGRTTSQQIIKTLQLNPNTRVKDMTTEQEHKLQTHIKDHLTVEGDLRRERILNIKRLKEINAYRGIRHSKKLPVRGQRTKTNSRTVRGNKRVTMGSGRKTSAQKT